MSHALCACCTSQCPPPSQPAFAWHLPSVSALLYGSTSTHSMRCPRKSPALWQCNHSTHPCASGKRSNPQGCSQADCPRWVTAGHQLHSLKCRLMHSADGTPDGASVLSSLASLAASKSAVAPSLLPARFASSSRLRSGGLPSNTNLQCNYSHNVVVVGSKSCYVRKTTSSPDTCRMAAVFRLCF